MSEWGQRKFLEYRFVTGEITDEFMYTVMTDLLALDDAVACTVAGSGPASQIVVLFKHEDCGSPPGGNRAMKALPFEWNEIVLPSTMANNFTAFGYETRESIKARQEPDLDPIKRIIST